MKKLGVDLSEYQRGIDFQKLKDEGVEFVIIRGGDGSYLDKCFADFYDKAKSVGLPVGAYWLSRVTTEEDAAREAEYFYEKCLKGRQFELPIYMDVECKAQQNLSREQLTFVCDAWVEKMKSLGFVTGVYTSSSWVSGEIYRDDLDCELWLAQWSYIEPRYSYGIWQFGGETNYQRSNQIAGYVVDQNWMIKDYPSIIKAAGKNGFPKPEEAQREQELIAEAQKLGCSVWAIEACKKAIAGGAFKGDGAGNYGWRDGLTREQFAQVLLNLGLLGN